MSNTLTFRITAMARGLKTCELCLPNSRSGKKATAFCSILGWPVGWVCTSCMNDWKAMWQEALAESEQS